MRDLPLIAVLEGMHPAAAAPKGLMFVPQARHTGVLATSGRWRLPFPQTRKQALQDAAQRQAHLERLMGFGTVFPVRPGFTLRPDATHALLRTNEPTFDRLHERLDGMVQFQITIRWDAERVLDHFRDAPEIVPLFTGPPVSPSALRAAVNRLVTRLQGEIWQMLQPVAKEVLTLPVTEDVLINAALLISRQDLFNLDLAVERIDVLWTEGFHIRQIGPSPAVSFALLDPVWHPAASIRGAYGTLGLLPSASTEDIALARRIALKRAGSNIGQVRLAAQLLAAASQVNDVGEGLFLCQVRSEDQSMPAALGAAVA